MLWEVEIHPAPNRPDRDGARVLKQCRALAADSISGVRAARSFLIQGDLPATAVEKIAAGFLADTVVETYKIRELTSGRGTSGATGSSSTPFGSFPACSDRLVIFAAAWRESLVSLGCES